MGASAKFTYHYFYVSFSDGKITKQLLKSKTGEFDIESIHSLTLSELGIDNIFILLYNILI